MRPAPRPAPLRRALLSGALRVALPFGVLALGACGGPPGAPVRFVYDTGHPAIPPEYTYVDALIGDVGADRIEARLRIEGPEGLSERRATLTGADFDSVMATVRATEVDVDDPANDNTGGSRIGVTLTDAAGRDRRGPPSNPEDWRRVLALVRARAGMDGAAGDGAPPD